MCLFVCVCVCIHVCVCSQWSVVAARHAARHGIYIYARSPTRLIDMHSSADLSARHLLCLDSDVPVIFLIFLLTVFIFSGLCNWQYHSLFTSWECHFHATPRAIISHMYFIACHHPQLYGASLPPLHVSPSSVHLIPYSPPPPFLPLHCPYP